MADRGRKRNGPAVSSNFNRLCFRRALIDREIGNRRTLAIADHPRAHPQPLLRSHIPHHAARLVTNSMPDRAFIAKEFFRKRVVENAQPAAKWANLVPQIPCLPELKYPRYGSNLRLRGSLLRAICSSAISG